MTQILTSLQISPFCLGVGPTPWSLPASVIGSVLIVGELMLCAGCSALPVAPPPTDLQVGCYFNLLMLRLSSREAYGMRYSRSVIKASGFFTQASQDIHTEMSVCTVYVCITFYRI